MISGTLRLPRLALLPLLLCCRDLITVISVMALNNKCSAFPPPAHRLLSHFLRITNTYPAPLVEAQVSEIINVVVLCLIFAWSWGFDNVVKGVWHVCSSCSTTSLVIWTLSYPLNQERTVCVDFSSFLGIFQFL